MNNIVFYISILIIILLSGCSSSEKYSTFIVPTKREQLKEKNRNFPGIYSCVDSRRIYILSFNNDSSYYGTINFYSEISSELGTYELIDNFVIFNKKDTMIYNSEKKTICSVGEKKEGCYKKIKFKKDW